MLSITKARGSHQCTPDNCFARSLNHVSMDGHPQKSFQFLQTNQASHKTKLVCPSVLFQCKYFITTILMVLMQMSASNPMTLKALYHADVMLCLITPSHQLCHLGTGHHAELGGLPGGGGGTGGPLLSAC